MSNKEKDNIRYIVAMGYLSDDEARRNLTKAVNILKKLVEEGNSEATYQLGEVYYWNLLNGKPNFETAAKYYKIAAKQGHSDAAYRLGFMYHDAFIGKEPDFSKAIKYYKIAAKKECSKALHMLGLLYFRGNGVEQNYPKAYELFSEAYEKGDPDSKCFLDQLVDYFFSN